MSPSSSTSDVSCIFINHSCLLIKTPEGDILCDPWFTGRVFNESWSLLNETNLDDLDLSNLRYIWVSHEHPDHLHFQTLREIKKKLSQPLFFFYRAQENKAVVNEITKLGYEIYELTAGRESRVTERLSFYTEEAMMDTCLVVKYDNFTLINQNDCPLDSKAVARIKAKYPNPDIHLYQFSLSGYYANSNDTSRLLKAKLTHRETSQHYRREFNAKFFVPFASYVSFCKVGNSYLNPYRVTPLDIYNDSEDKSRILIPWYLSELQLSESEANNLHNLSRWQDEFSKEVSLQAEAIYSETEIYAVVDKLFEKLNQKAPWFLPGPALIHLRGLDQILELNLRDRSRRLISVKGNSPHASVGDSDFMYALKFPWGADTLNITGNLHIVSQFKWRRLLYALHVRHALFAWPSFAQGLAALAGAGLRSLQFLMGR